MEVLIVRVLAQKHVIPRSLRRGKCRVFVRLLVIGLDDPGCGLLAAVLRSLCLSCFSPSSRRGLVGESSRVPVLLRQQHRSFAKERVDAVLVGVVGEEDLAAAVVRLAARVRLLGSGEPPPHEHKLPVGLLPDALDTAQVQVTSEEFGVRHSSAVLSRSGDSSRRRQALGAVPLTLRNFFQRRMQASHVPAPKTSVALKHDVVLITALTARSTGLQLVVVQISRLVTDDIRTISAVEHFAVHLDLLVVPPRSHALRRGSFSLGAFLVVGTTHRGVLLTLAGLLLEPLLLSSLIRLGGFALALRDLPSLALHLLLPFDLLPALALRRGWHPTRI